MERTFTAQTNLSSYNNDSYKPGSSFKRILWFVLGRVFINTYLPIPQKIKFLVLRAFGSKIGQRVVLKPRVNIKYPWFLTIGNDVWIGEKVWIDNLAQVTIQDHVCLSQACYLLTGNHDFTKSSFDLITKPITIEQGAWIGAQAVVCPGVTVGTHAVLTVSSVAVKNLDAYSINQGNPAVYIKQRHIKS
jgi:putative colanic acid biosynthesis acetyltransferase WcaF